MAGTVTAGMCAALEALGMLDSFDAIYGSSAGAINASYLAGGRSELCGPLYVLAAELGLVSRGQVIKGAQPFRLAELFGALCRQHEHSPRALGRHPELRLTATLLPEGRPTLLGDFRSLPELRVGMRASCSIPFRAEEVAEFRGGRYADGGLSDPIPYRLALQAHATHVLVLRSRPESYRHGGWRGPQRKAVETVLRDAPDPVLDLVFRYPNRYNALATELESQELGHRVTQVAPPANARRVGPLECRPDRLLSAIAIGADTVYRLLVGKRPGSLFLPALDRA